MSNSDRTIRHENVNGIMLALKIEGRNSSPKSRQFTITYGDSRDRDPARPWYQKSVVSVGIGMLVNLIALIYTRINLTILVVIVTLTAFLIFLWITHSVQTESLLVIPTVGVQTSAKFVVGREDNFIPWPNVDDIIINESIVLDRVLCVLSLIVKENGAANPDDTTKLVTLFKYTKPRLMMLETIYSEIRDLLLETTLGGSGDASADNRGSTSQ